jgi:hypothetical protein
MNLHIGSEIRRVLEKNGTTPDWLATQINTSRRNLYDILNREEINTGQLFEISKALDFNFFELYQAHVEEPKEEYKIESRDKVSVVVHLDGLQTTLDKWIAKLTSINQIL